MHFVIFSMLCRLHSSWDPVPAELLKTLQRNSGDSNKLNIKESLIKLEFYKLKWLKLNKIVAANWFKFRLFHELRLTSNRILRIVQGLLLWWLLLILKLFVLTSQTGDLLLCSNNADVSKIWDKKSNFFNNSALTLQQCLRSGLSQYPMLVRGQILSESKCQFHASASWGRRYICT